MLEGWVAHQVPGHRRRSGLSHNLYVLAPGVQCELSRLRRKSVLWLSIRVSSNSSSPDVRNHNFLFLFRNYCYTSHLLFRLLSVLHDTGASSFRYSTPVGGSPETPMNPGTVLINICYFLFHSFLIPLETWVFFNILQSESVLYPQVRD